MTPSPVREWFARLTALGTRTRLLVLGAVTAVVVWTIASVVFPYHSVNHDEAVYLQQAAMLLDGKLFLTPPVEDAFRPWFFVESAQGLYPKYSPVPAAMFAVGELVDAPRIALALIAAGCVVLTQRVVAMTFDERTGCVAALLLLASPLFLVDASVFLPYVPTTFLNLAFAAAYLRADRTESRRVAAIAGLAVALAFFARPYTAVLFALPFVAHALWTMRTLDRTVVGRQVTTAAVGLLGVAATLAYNATVTGDPLLFPYEAFAPLDGLGFGRRELLGYAREYTVELGLWTNAEALWLFATRWVAAGIVGTLFALLGIAVAVRRGLTDRQAILAGVAGTVPLGNVYFWGTLNALGDLSTPNDGLAHYLGPYYHADLLVPFVAFGAVGVLATVRWSRTLVERVVPRRRVRPAVLATFLVLAAVGGATAAAVAADPLSDNAAVSEQLETAYEPFEDRSLDDSIVFLPTPHGDWLNHPLQALENDPDYRQATLYALQVRQFAVLDAFPDRTAYRYTYYGDWNPRTGDPVTSHLQPIERVSGPGVSTDVTMTVPGYGERLLVTLSGDEGSTFTSVPVRSDTVTGQLRVENETATLRFDGTDATARIPVEDRDRLTMRAALDTGVGTTLTYAVELPVKRANGTVAALSPYQEICREERRCGGQAAYVPGTFGEDVHIETTLSP